jgi:hypothetical protein
METQISFLVGIAVPLALAAGLSLFVLAFIETLIDKLTDYFNG